MYENVKIGMIGGDMRQVSLCRRLSDMGFETAIWGFSGKADIGKAVRSHKWQDVVNGSRAVILPLPVTVDGENVFMPYADDVKLGICDVFRALSPDTLLLGGNLSDTVKNIAKINNVPLVDYFDCEELKIKNAVPTAEGAIEIAMRETPITLNNSSVLVCGYGRIGKVLSSLLKSLGATVYVSARRHDDIAYITVSGNKAVRYGSDCFFNALKKVDIVFNTVPAMVLDKTVIEKLSSCCLIVDLASGSGGTDFDAAKKCGIKSIHALSLPGKVAPVTAGEIISGCVLETFLREGVITHL